MISHRQDDTITQRMNLGTGQTGPLAIVVGAGRGVTVEGRGTKSDNQYSLPGHGLGGPVVVEPSLIARHEDAIPYAACRHGGVAFIYMLTGEVVYRHGDRTYYLLPGDALLSDSADQSNWWTSR
jgi:hypothetical protein